ncbi:protein sprouty homolog 2 isoform X2 [Tenrec ecaudatus]|uniref:protein sprouty homolog 2 isoform X2 n=1 Tax=Tenrec ecaudatus TaxID=94439 RepID=UPI003F5A8FE3
MSWDRMRYILWDNNCSVPPRIHMTPFTAAAAAAARPPSSGKTRAPARGAPPPRPAPRRPGPGPTSASPASPCAPTAAASASPPRLRSGQSARPGAARRAASGGQGRAERAAPRPPRPRRLGRDAASGRSNAWRVSPRGRLPGSVAWLPVKGSRRRRSSGLGFIEKKAAALRVSVREGRSLAAPEPPECPRQGTRLGVCFGVSPLRGSEVALHPVGKPEERVRPGWIYFRSPERGRRGRPRGAGGKLRSR